MLDNNPIQYKGKVVDQRNTLTGPDDGNKVDYPKRPKNVTISQQYKKQS